MTQDHATLTEVRPTRRTLTRAALWTVPVVAVAATAPAYAASCASERVSSNGSVTTYTRDSAIKWRGTFDADGAGPKPSNVMTIDATYDSGMVVRNDGPNGTFDNFTILSPVGGLGTSGIVLAQRPTADTPTAPLAALGHYKFTFTRAVTNLSFTLTDIDSASGDFLDAVQLSPGFAFRDAAAGLTGVGTAASPFKQKTADVNADNSSSGAGNVTITYPGPLTTFTVSYGNQAASFATGVDQDQVVTITNIAFDYMPC